jgi:hypothetical protein
VTELLVRDVRVGDVIAPGLVEVTEVHFVGDGSLVWCRDLADVTGEWQCRMGKTDQPVSVGQVGRLVETGRMWLTFQPEVQ